MFFGEYWISSRPFNPILKEGGLPPSYPSGVNDFELGGMICFGEPFVLKSMAPWTLNISNGSDNAMKLDNFNLNALY
jgi:hypothetical protein